jgi:hypothetical protein
MKLDQMIPNGAVGARWVHAPQLMRLSALSYARVIIRFSHEGLLLSVLLTFVAAFSVWSYALDQISLPVMLLVILAPVLLWALFVIAFLAAAVAWRLVDENRVVILSGDGRAVIDLRGSSEGFILANHSVLNVGRGQGRKLREALARRIKESGQSVRFQAQNLAVANVYRQQFPSLEVSQCGSLTGKIHLSYTSSKPGL